MRPVALAAVLVVGMGAGQPAADDSGRSFLWQVTSDTTTVYLLGSVHLMKPDAYPLGEAIEGAFNRSRVTAFEVDLDQLTAAALKLLSAGTLPEGTTLRDVVSAETYELTSKRIRELGMDPDGFQKMRPWLLAVTLTSYELARAGYAKAEGVDMHFFTRAKEGDKTRLALETVDFQVSLFANLDADDDEAFLQYTMKDLDAVIPFVDDLLTRWKAGDVAEVERLLTEAYSDFPELFGKMVRDRNRNWLPQVEELLSGDESAMVVVGALHLVGEEGLVELLKARGYRVEQL